MIASAGADGLTSTHVATGVVCAAAGVGFLVLFEWFERRTKDNSHDVRRDDA